MFLALHVRPNTSRTEVGGSHDDALVVRVTEPADGGRANLAVLDALAEALGVPRGRLTLIRGATSRRKLVEITIEPTPALEERIVELRDKKT